MNKINNLNGSFSVEGEVDFLNNLFVSDGLYAHKVNGSMEEDINELKNCVMGFFGFSAQPVNSKKLKDLNFVHEIKIKFNKIQELKSSIEKIKIDINKKLDRYKSCAFGIEREITICWKTLKQAEGIEKIIRLSTQILIPTACVLGLGAFFGAAVTGALGFYGVWIVASTSVGLVSFVTTTAWKIHLMLNHAFTTYDYVVDQMEESERTVHSDVVQSYIKDLRKCQILPPERANLTLNKIDQESCDLVTSKLKQMLIDAAITSNCAADIGLIFKAMLDEGSIKNEINLTCPENNLENKQNIAYEVVNQLIKTWLTPEIKVKLIKMKAANSEKNSNERQSLVELEVEKIFKEDVNSKKLILDMLKIKSD